MVSREKKKPVISLLSFLLLMSIQSVASAQLSRMDKVNNLYSCIKEYDIECPREVLAIAIYETGWMECHHCSYQFNNLFGFRAGREYLKFGSIYDCLQYLHDWQVAFYDPWKLKHPKGTYYEYLIHVRYARSSMSNYILTIKSIERLVAKNTAAIDSLPLTYPSVELEGK